MILNGIYTVTVGMNVRLGVILSISIGHLVAPFVVADIFDHISFLLLLKFLSLKTIGCCVMEIATV